MRDCPTHFSRHQKLWIGLAFALGFLARMHWLTEQNEVQPMFNSDEYLYYISTAENAFQGRGFYPSYNEMIDGVYVPPPMQSWYMLGVFKLFGDTNWVWPKAIQALLASLVIMLCAGIGRRLHSQLAGIVFAYLFALYPPFIFFNGYLLTESNYLSALVLLIWFLLRWSEQPDMGRACLSGVWLGVMHLQRINLMYFGFLLAVLSCWRRGIKKGYRAALCFLVLPALILSPWLVRNLVVYGEPILVSSNVGFNFYFSNHAKLDPIETPLFEDVVKKGNMWNPEIEGRYRKDGKLNVTYYRYSQAYMSVALEYIKSQPVHFMKNYIIKFANQFVLFQPIGYQSIKLFRYEAAALVLHWLVLVGGLLGLIECCRAWRDCQMQIMLLVFGYLALLGGCFIQSFDGRWNLFLKLFQLLFIAVGVSRLWTSLAHRSQACRKE